MKISLVSHRSGVEKEVVYDQQYALMHVKIIDYFKRPVHRTPSAIGLILSGITFGHHLR